MALTVENLGTAKLEESPFKVILYGPAGGGKTHLMRSFPKPLLYLDFDDKREPLIGVDGIEAISYYLDTPENAPKIWRKFWGDVNSLKTDTRYSTVVIDSVTALDRVLVRSCVIEGGRSAMAKAEIQHYGDVKNWYTMLFNVFKSIKKNIILLAHEDYKIDGDSGVHSILPLITGSTSAEVASIFKDTWYLELSPGTTGLKRTLHYQQFKKRVCTSTTLSGTGAIEEPTYEKICACRRKI